MASAAHEGHIGSRHEIVAVLLLAVTVFLFAATVSDQPAGYRDDGRTTSNWCGPVGAFLGGGLYFLLGYGAYLLQAFGLVAAVLCWRGSDVPDLRLRMVGLLGLLFSALGLFEVWSPDGAFASERTPGPGGLLGAFLGLKLTDAFGVMGTSILLTAAALISATLATGWLLLTFVAFARDQLARFGQYLMQHDESPPSSRKATSKPAKSSKPRRAKTSSPEDAEVEGDVEAPETWEEGAEDKVDEEEAAELEEESDPLEEAEPGLDLFEEPAPRSRKPKRERRKVAEADEEDEEVSGPDPMQVTAPVRPEQVDYEPPPLDLLEPVPEKEIGPKIEGKIRKKALILQSTLRNFKIDARVVAVERGPVIALFELELAAGVKLNRVTALSDDLAIALKAPNVRIVAPIPGKNTVGIEVPNEIREPVNLRSLLQEGERERAAMAIPLFLGRDASGRPLVEDLARMPHLMIAGSTGSGKSVCINSIILSVLFTRSPAEIKLILVDPKMVELSYFCEIPHLLCPVVTDMRKAPGILDWAVDQMERRYELFTRAGVRNINSYNALGEDGLRRRMGEDVFDVPVEPPPLFLQYIVIVVDELADLMMVAAKEIENSITRLAQKSRAVGIHIILATQRPSTNVITGLIKANLPTRISFQVASKIDSRVVLDRNGAEKLLGSGDLLYLPPRTSKLVRAQGTFVSDDEVRSTVQHLREHRQPEFNKDLVQDRAAREDNDEPPWERDVLYVEAARTIVESQRGSASLLQRKFGIGYTRASRLIDMMAEQGVVGDFKGSQAREVLLTPEEFEEQVAALEAD